MCNSIHKSHDVLQFTQVVCKTRNRRNPHFVVSKPLFLSSDLRHSVVLWICNIHCSFSFYYSWSLVWVLFPVQPAEPSQLLLFFIWGQQMIYFLTKAAVIFTNEHCLLVPCIKETSWSYVSNKHFNMGHESQHHKSSARMYISQWLLIEPRDW